MSWLSTLIYGKDPGPTATDTAAKQATTDAGTMSKAANSQYMTANAGFNPEQAFKTYASGAEGDFNTQLSSSLRDLSGKAVGAGRFDSGFYDEDQGQVVRNVAGDFNNKIAQGALTASGQRLSQIGQEGQYALGEQGLYGDMLSGQLDRETAAANAKKQQRSSFWSGLFGVGGAALGAGGAVPTMLGKSAVAGG